MAKSRIARINGKMYDLGTRNKSFVEVAHQLKLKGVKNFYFMLELNDVSLINVDPFAVDKDGRVNLTRDQISRVINECAINPWYFLREVCLLPDQGGKPVHYKANRGNIAQAYLSLHSFDSWLTITRQSGKTMSFLALLEWVYSFGTTDSEFIFLNKSGDDCKKNLDRVRSLIDLLPEYMRFKYIITEEGKTEKGKDNATFMSHPITHNSIRTTAKASTPDAAMKLGRGLTVPVIFSDETEFTDYIDVIMANAFMAFKTASDNAKRNHAFTCRAFTSTPKSQIGAFILNINFTHLAFKIPLNAGKPLMRQSAA